ncbi:hypothetical protein CLV78_102230 [Aliiruegeria haliotis]|uniref:YmgG-like glycine-zipper protein n=1 Tax=Aliiruegeria haliotis TaxID=1280846 RepID=A0A2T0RVH2_9RHOB|nr:hypothetical protein [Aliiruegeria haliotis]PRY25053.1 hypothetical protein CLV78_102230 [Aliiruegeria haliotis]
MAHSLRILAAIAIVGLLAACDSNTNLENAGIGAATGAGVAAVTGTSVATGTAIGAAAGALTNEVKKAAR